MINYSRQMIFDQEKLRNAKITIIGAGALSNYLCLYLSGLGIQNITLLNNDYCKNAVNEFLIKNFKGPKVYALEERIKEINPSIKFSGINSHIIDFLIGQPDVIVDLTNDPTSKKKVKEIAKNIKGVKKVINASSSENNGSIRTYIPLTKGPTLLKKGTNPQALILKKDDYLLECYKSFNQGSFTSGLIAAIVLDEIRKTILPLNNEEPLRSKVDFSLYSNKRFNEFLKFDEEKENLSNLNALVVGAGGIGTYVCLNLALMGIGNIDLYDGDIIEDHNLNRQVFYYNEVGQKKSRILAERLNKLFKPCVTPYTTYLKDLSRLEGYDAIFSCLDNWEYRFKLSDYAIKKKIPFIDGSVTTFNAYANFSNCLSCKYDSKSLVEDEKNNARGSGSCVNIANSNVVMANAFVGALMASEVKALAFPTKYPSLKKKEFSYTSQSADFLKFNLSDHVLNCLCYKKSKGCECHENE